MHIFMCCIVYTRCAANHLLDANICIWIWLCVMLFDVIGVPLPTIRIVQKIKKKRNAKCIAMASFFIFESSIIEE